MTDELDFNALPEGDGAAAAAPFETDLARLTDVSVELAVEVGRTHMSLGEAMSLGPGSVVTLDRLADKPVDLLVNGRSIARGEVVVIDEQFGLRITEVVGVQRGASTPQAQPAEFAAVEDEGGIGALGGEVPMGIADPGGADAGGDSTMDADAIAALFAQAENGGEPPVADAA